MAVAAKSTSDAHQVSPFPPDPHSLHSTINTVQREIEEAGGLAIAVAVDVRDVSSIQHMVDEVVQVSFGLLSRITSANTRPEIREPRRAHLQLWRYLVV